ncbi:hypothetical protein BC939DRAFT_493438 [Gamsiella multidivaricata]|uniref:uncharacterized protein n=1 Tax=Gamsiella multidivaricata TaxID=101098 RepID=UPI002220665F|nr:uncharacterized protein BC939DRAFT_493438 [Gamsiella multidivaricata]KAI7822660.1 hypothetical protein BC939DRAFT_493438 [Gamsiella multidivaricata]
MDRTPHDVGINAASNLHGQEATKRLNTQREPWFPGVAYAGAAGVAGYALVHNSRSMPVKILTPLTMAALAGAYFLPVHTAVVKPSQYPGSVRTVSTHSTSPTAEPLREVKEQLSTGSTLAEKTSATADDLSRQTKSSWNDIKRKGENLAEAGQDQIHKLADGSAQEAKSSWDNIKRKGEHLAEAGQDQAHEAKSSWDNIKRKGENLAEAGQDQIHKLVDGSAQEAKSSWDNIKRKGEHLAEAGQGQAREAKSSWDNIKRKGEHLAEEGQEQAHEAKSWMDEKTADMKAKASSAATGAEQHTSNKFHQDIPENPSSSRWSWWKGTESTPPKPEVADKNVNEALISNSTTDNISPEKKHVVERPLTEATVPASSSSSSSKPRKILIDKAVASAAVKGHDDIVNRAALAGKNAEQTALKVHENVIDAALPKERQSRNEKHQIEVSRLAAESDMRDGKFIVREPEDATGIPQRVQRRGSQSKKATSHGLENLEKRAHMLYDGVEHIEHSLNKKMQKALNEEAEFWHQQSLKEQASGRGGERAM